jgi:hypothetical protein
MLTDVQMLSQPNHKDHKNKGMLPINSCPTEIILLPHADYCTEENTSVSITHNVFIAVPSSTHANIHNVIIINLLKKFRLLTQPLQTRQT